jgi:hypothetical protein
MDRVRRAVENAGIAQVAYNRDMSKGWESKSIEERQAEAASAKPSTKKLDDHAAHKEEAERKRRRRELELQRERILAERTSSPHRRSALAAALEEIEVKLGELGWTLHID